MKQILENVWEVDNFFPNFDQVRRLHRNIQTPWNAQYKNRLLTPWESTPEIQSILHQHHGQIQDIIQRSISPQVSYVSIDLPGAEILMHRLHPEICCFVQVCLADESSTQLATHFIQSEMPGNYYNVRDFSDDVLVPTTYTPNTAIVYLNEPRWFLGTKIPVPPNMLRETFNMHFGFATTETQ